MVSVRELSLMGQWTYVLSAFFSFVWYLWQLRKGRCKWEVLYVSSMVRVVITSVVGRYVTRYGVSFAAALVAVVNSLGTAGGRRPRCPPIPTRCFLQ